MTKTEFINAIAELGGFTKAQAGAAYDAFVGAVVKGLKEDKKVALVGFGNFELKDVAKKEGKNPATGAKIVIPASKKPVLKISKAFKDSFNK